MRAIKVKNMVCPRCILTVEEIADQLGLKYQSVSLGTILMCEDIQGDQFEKLETALNLTGLELLDGRLAKIIEGVNEAIDGYLLVQKIDRHKKLSTYISSKVHFEYCYLSSLYSSIEGRTIERTYIIKRIQKAKALLEEGEYSLTEIAGQLGFATVHHLSAQFKRITGLTPSKFRKLRISAVEE
jgi:AraC family transcriptional regulator